MGLIISPTHAEGERVTREVRAKLKAAKKLGADEREFVQLKNLQWTQAQRADARNYQTGMVIQFHQNVPGFRRGERVMVFPDKIKSPDGLAPSLLVKLNSSFKAPQVKLYRLVKPVPSVLILNTAPLAPLPPP